LGLTTGAVRGGCCRRLYLGRTVMIFYFRSPWRWLLSSCWAPGPVSQPVEGRIPPSVSCCFRFIVARCFCFALSILWRWAGGWGNPKFAGAGPRICSQTIASDESDPKIRKPSRALVEGPDQNLVHAPPLARPFDGAGYGPAGKKPPKIGRGQEARTSRWEWRVHQPGTTQIQVARAGLMAPRFGRISAWRPLPMVDRDDLVAVGQREERFLRGCPLIRLFRVSDLHRYHPPRWKKKTMPGSPLVANFLIQLGIKKRGLGDHKPGQPGLVAELAFARRRLLWGDFIGLCFAGSALYRCTAGPHLLAPGPLGRRRALNGQ